MRYALISAGLVAAILAVAGGMLNRTAPTWPFDGRLGKSVPVNTQPR